MPVGDVIKRITFPSEMSEWNDLSIEEKYQRNISIKRIKNEIAPYFANNTDRFSGSLILAIKDRKNISFEAVSKFTNNLPSAYDSENMGFLTIRNEEMFIPLDGQHRVKAFKMVVEGNSDEPQILPNSKLGNDYVSAIIIEFDKFKSRYIFNKINKYAKPTMKGDKLITDDDDAVAIISRELVTSGVIPERLVNTQSNSLSKKSFQFTTLGTIYEATMALINGAKVPCATKPSNMPESERKKQTADLTKEWKMLISEINTWSKMIKDPSEKGDANRIKIRKTSLLAWPVGQRSLIKGYAFVCQRKRNTDRKALIKKIAKINWNFSNRVWESILVQPNKRIMYGKPVVNNATKVIAHMIGADFTEKEKSDLLVAIYGRKRGKRLPNPIN